MKKAFILALALMSMSVPAITVGTLSFNEKVHTSWSQFVSAVIEVESGGDDKAIGDTHLVGNEAVGCLQIRPVMIREVNRIQKKKVFTLADRYSRSKSIEIFNLIADGDRNLERVARRWNGGARGDRKKSTEDYWSKVKRILI